MTSLISEFCLVAGVHALAVASPGPDLAIVLQTSIKQGRRAALWTSWGIGSGIFFHIAYSILGIGFLLKNYPESFEIIRYAGAVYLAWLGVKALMAKPTQLETNESAPLEIQQMPNQMRGAFTKGFFVNVLNPKAALFFIALFTSGISTETPTAVKAGYGVWMALATAFWFSMVSLFLTKEKVRQTFLRFGHWFDRGMGVLLILLAVRLTVASLGTTLS